ncbi:ammonia-dependent NAD(+) synthetase [Colwellia sp. 4_MG-2023]|jgi:NAD+ synthase|uniref:ammonia-dependent NAD(+) synthetase n=1 Tax=unclassified Colwellia TaxID=196834 RepID=UPI001C084F37|nr:MULTISPECIES: ammonia-dependent NAD(+) synthetase [unclassified Colwellia]MBU2925370.1 ammonia-dependent NAD(+) synthetase [Colwellia sp. C2M11]MDO6487953.1 ammonia-dependent NAD(+) synthetase [Colwellia sp. 6_MG-2023]MDO6506048.1 ammonia-dependent NAD(+) synthetase [Colwellia sp. 5_MG-2023]MDO6554892.1 ammonia-dependent NAD(+) synthetase [Colwellia sp. 4_MG-2023]MDO6653500.1 ammonia-dependent NAD(+) synthetase [Colwellia sp. 3_MG-2023]
MDQQTIIDEMKVLPKIDAHFEVRRRIDFIKSTLKNSGLKTLVLGISGGVDSSTCGRLAQLAVSELNAEQNKDIADQFQFIAVRLPYNVQADEDDAQTALNFIQPSHCLTTNVFDGVNGIHQEVVSALNNAQLLTASENQVDFSKGNVKARIRMVSQYHIAGILGALVLGTDHSAENITGFFTKWGDGACDLAPLFGLSKRQVRIIAKHLGAPDILVEKAPTADLEDLDPGKTDEDALGISYDELDDFLEGKNVSSDIQEHIINIYKKTQHKRQPIPTIYS